MHRLCFISLFILAFLVGCETAPPMTQTQVDALEIREIEVGADRAFTVASSALLDSGYLIHVSDADAGLLTAERREDPSATANAAVIILTAILTRGFGTSDKAPDYHAVCIEVLPETATRSKVRIRLFLNGQVLKGEDPVGRKTVQELWTLMQRQVLMKEPAR